MFALIAFPLAVFANSSDLGEISVYFNGQRMEFDQPPVIVNDRTMVPFRAIFEAFGAEIEWNQELRQIVATHTDPSRIVLNIGSDRAFINGAPHYLDAAPFVALETSRTLVPIRFVSEAFGADVDWDNEARNVIITANVTLETPQWEDHAVEIVGGGTAIDPEQYEAAGHWHPTHRNQVVAGNYYNVRGWRISAASYIEMIAERDRIAQEIFTPGMTEFEVIRAAHNWLVYNVSYNTDVWSRQRLQQTGSGWNPNWQPVRYPHEHQMAWSALVLRTAVCAGYTDALIYLLEPFGVEALYVSGPLFNQGFSEGTHAWNLVRMGNQWYHIDATWNRFYSGGQHMVTYTWFLLSDDDVRNTGDSTRSWSMSHFPSAPNTFAWNRPTLVWDHGLNRWRTRIPADETIFSISTSTNINNAGNASTNLRNSRAGQWITVNAQANPGFEFERWEVVSGGISFHSQAGTTATFMMPESNVSVRAVFRQIGQTHNVTLTTNNEQAGRAIVSPFQNVQQGTWVSLQAQPNPGETFERWEIVSGSANIQNPTFTSTGFYMPASNVAVRAVFRLGQSVTVNVNDARWGTANTSHTANVVQDTWVNITANPADGFDFVRWEVVSGGMSIENPNSATTRFQMPTGNVSIRAVFAERQGLSVDISVSSPQAGTASANPSVPVQGHWVQLLALPNPGFNFERWEVISGTVVVQNPTSATTGFHMPSGNVSIRAVFVQAQTFSVNIIVDNATHGIAHASPSTGLQADSNVTLTAQPSFGHMFSHWEIVSGDVNLSSTTAASLVFRMPAGDVTLRAVFTTLTTFSVSAISNNPTAGTASVWPTSAVPGDTVTLTATAMPGYVFSHWQVNQGTAGIDNVTSATTGLQVVLSNVVVQAVFVPE